MVNHTCYRCNYTTTRKYNMETHLSRKKICTAENNNIELNLCKEYILKGLSYLDYKELIDNNTDNNNQNISLDNQNISLDTQNISLGNQNISLDKLNSKNKCKYCNNLFTLKNNLTRHLKSCKLKNSEIELLKNNIEVLKTENNKNNEEIEELKDIIKYKNSIINEYNKNNKVINNNINSNNNNNTTNNNTNNHITINNYITPNIQYLEYNIKKECIYTDYVYFLPILKALFFNKEYPENHSISYSNTRSNKMSVFNGNEWILQNRMDTINDIINNCDDILSEFINDIRNSDNITYKQGKMINLYEKYISNYSLNDDDYKSLHEYIYMESNNLNIKPPIK